MKILLHTCCGPCSIYPVSVLRDMDYDVMGYYHRTNIHPFQECQKRENTLKDYAQSIDLNIICQRDYDIETFLRGIAFREEKRCHYCYHDRLNATALVAKKGKFDAFTTSLLYSKFQNHELIKEIGKAIAKKHGVSFFYHDFRDGWKLGIEESKKLNMYRQQYCGCIYSEKERFYK